MAGKIATFLIIAAANAAAGLFVLFILLIGLNGYSERVGTFALGFFIVGALVVALLSGFAGVWAYKFFNIRKKWSAFAAALVSVLIFSTVGAVLNVIWGVASVLFAEILRKS